MSRITAWVGRGFTRAVHFSRSSFGASGAGERRDADPEFVRTVYAEHGEALLGYAIRMVGDRSRAEDIVQETLLRAWKHAGHLAADGPSLRPWLFTIAAHLAADVHRAGGARPVEVGEDAPVSVPAEDERDRTSQSSQVAEALRTLPPAHRAVLVETYYRGQSVSETAEVLGIPADTVKSCCYYALRRLQLALLEQGGEP